MKINAIRLAEFGRFAQPVAIEGLSGRLNVLAGPNELGKSTLLAALRAGFFTNFGSQKKELKELRPYGGGAPTVEIEFEAGQRLYRLRKRFLTQPIAELRDLSGGQLLRGPEAEAELARLTGGQGGAGRFGLAWVDQRGTLAPLVPAGLDDGLPSLHRALTREVEAVATGGRTKHVHSEVRRLLAEVMGHGGTRPRGAFDTALKALKTKSGEYAKAQADLALALDRIEQLGSLRAAEADLASATATADRKARIETSRAALEAASAARARRDVLAEALKSAEADLAQKRRTQADCTRNLAELAGLATAEVQLRQSKTALDSRAQALTATVNSGRQQLDGLRRDRESLDRQLTAARAAERRQVAAVQANELIQRGRSADVLAARCQELGAILTASTATPEVLKAASLAAAGIRESEARLQAAAPIVVIDYLPGAEGRLQLGGRPLGQGETLLASTPITIEIAGIGRISVAPGGAAAVTGTQAALGKHRMQLAEHLAHAGVADLAALEAAVEQRRSAGNAHAEATTRLAALAPDGLDALRQKVDMARHAACETATAAAGEVLAEPSRPCAVIEAEILAITASIAGLERTLDPAGRELASLREALAGLAAEAGTLRCRHGELAAALPATTEERTTAALALAAAATSAEALVNRTIRDLAAWADQVPDATALDALQKGCAAAEATERTCGTELARLRTEAARLEGALAEARNEDVDMRAASLGQAVEHLETEARRFAEDVAALQLLDQEFAAEEARSREQFLAPVMARLRPYLDTLFPAAQVSFDAALAPEGIERLAGQSRIIEQLDRTSDGTQEQIAVLVRLAFARLFADTGTAVPLILDDALVYADDQRIAAMFRALEQAAEKHQVIVLTCRTMSFERLKGQRLTLEPWALAQAA